MSARQLNVLVGCEFSGTVRDAFIEQGHYAMSCDLLPSDNAGPHYQGDVFDIIDDGWDIGIFHPPCTYLCSSGLHWNRRGAMVDGRPRAELTEEALVFVQRLMDSSIPRWGLENPVGCIGTRIRKADQIIHPHQFGHDASKATCLWLKGLPLLVPTHHVPAKYACKCGARFDLDLGKYGCSNCFGEYGAAKAVWGNQTYSGQNNLPPTEDRWALRSLTYPGIAQAMARQWSAHVLAELEDGL